MDRAIDLIDRYQAATNRRVWVTDKLTAIIMGLDETQWLDDFEKEVLKKEAEAKYG